MPRPRVLLPAVVTVLALIGCTGEPPAPGGPPSPALPADVFPALPDRGPGIETRVEAMAGDGETLVMVATVEGRARVPVLRYSADAGATWRDAAPNGPASEAVIGEEAVGVAAVATRGQHRQWLAIGTIDRTLFARTSSDARVWDRTPITGIDPGRGEQVTSVAGFDGGGFVAVGGRWRDEQTWPMAWTSPDGISWTPREIAGQGWLTEVATRGDRAVAVGHRQLPEMTRGRSQSSLLVTSVDRGAGWRGVAVKEPGTSGNFVSYLEHVVATGSGFVVGGGYYDRHSDGYRPLLLTGSGAAGWRAVRRLPDAGESSDVDELLQLGSTTVAVQRASRAGTRDELRVRYLFAGDGSWTDGSTPRPARSARAAAGAAVGGVAVLAVSVEGDPGRGLLWRFQSPAQVGEIELAPPPGLRDNVRPEGLLVVEGRLGGYGVAQGAPVLWDAGGAGFGAARSLPLGAEETLGQVAWSADGGYLATGHHSADRAFVLHSPDGLSWRRTATQAFNPVAQYHWSTINGVTRANGRWVVVGAKSSNGTVRRSALVYSSADGRSWVQGAPTRVTRRGDWYDRRDPLDDLHGLDNRGREPRAVLAVGRSLVAVGETGSDRRARPAAWIAPDGRRWRLVALPSGDYPEASASAVVRVGDVLLADGWAFASGAVRSTRVAWRSSDGGRTWTFQAFPGDYSAVLLAAGDAEFLRVVLADDDRTVRLSRSSDGQGWSESTIGVDGLADGTRLDLLDALVHEDALHLLLTIRNRLDAVTVVRRVPL